MQQGIYDLVLDPNFASNHFYYVFYTLGSPNHDRVSRFTANASLTGTVAGSEFVLYEDPQDADAEHHGGALSFANDGKLLFTTGEHFQPAVSQSLTSPRGKVHRINPDGTVPTDNPFYDGSGPNIDSIWARGLRNPYRAYYDAPTGRYYIGDVGGNDASTAIEELDLGVRGANYGWPDSEGPCALPCQSPLFSYAHNGRDAAITGGFVYHGTKFPSSYRGAYFYADYTQNWIQRLEVRRQRRDHRHASTSSRRTARWTARTATSSTSTRARMEPCITSTSGIPTSAAPSASASSAGSSTCSRTRRRSSPRRRTRPPGRPR